MEKISTIKKTSKIPSLQDLKQKIESNTESSTEKNNVISVVENSFTIEELKKYWNEYLQELKKQDREVEYQLFAQSFELNEYIVTIQLPNPIQLDQLVQFKQELLDYLRKQLKNDKIDIKGEVIAIEQKKKIYTAEEKFAFLLEKNPALKDLKNQFDLDLDY